MNSSKPTLREILTKLKHNHGQTDKPITGDELVPEAEKAIISAIPEKPHKGIHGVLGRRIDCAGCTVNEIKANLGIGEKE